VIELLVSWCLIRRMDICIVQSVRRMARRFGGTVSHRERAFVLSAVEWE
jgi:hypothetical protein